MAVTLRTDRRVIEDARPKILEEIHMTDTIDRMARAMRDADAIWAARKYPEMNSDQVRNLVEQAGIYQGYQCMAGAALEILRDPSDAMLAAGEVAVPKTSRSSLANGGGASGIDLRRIWTAMVGQALKE